MNLHQRFRKTLLMFFLSFLFILSTSVSVFAASKPDKVTGFSAVAGESCVSFKWKKVKKADGYEFTVKDAKTGKLVKTVRIKKGSQVKATIKRLENGTSYTFTIRAYKNSSSGRVYSKYSKKLNATPMILEPGQPIVKLYSVGGGKVTLTWSAAANANFYVIYQKDDKGKYQQIGKTKKTSTTITGLTNNYTYEFRVYGFRKVGDDSRHGLGYSVEATPRTVISQTNDIIVGYKHAAIMATTVTTEKLNTSKKITIPAGSRVAVASYGSPNSVIQTADGSRAYVSNSTFYFSNDQPIAYNSDTPYSKLVAETYVNTVKQLTSPSNYLIWINIYTQHMYVFTGTKNVNGVHSGWNLAYTWKCITGNSEHKSWTGTPSNPNGICSLLQHVGTVATRGKLVFMDGGSFGYWGTWLSNLDNAIHSWRYWSHLPGDVLVDGTMLGKPVSNGCIRLAIQNAEYVYKNIPLGTTVIVG